MCLTHPPVRAQAHPPFLGEIIKWRDCLPELFMVFCYNARMSHILIEGISLFFVGILAGEEFIVRYGIQPAMAKLEDRAHVQTRIALVRRLKWVVPMIILPAVVASITMLVVSSNEPGGIYRWIGFAALVCFLLFSFLGTVPINMKVNDWNVDAPPSDWKTVVKRWEIIDTFRSTAAILAFGFFVIASFL